MAYLVPRPQQLVAGNGRSVRLADLMRMSALEIVTAYGKDVSELVAYLQAAGLVPRDGRSNEDLALQAQVRAQIAAEGDCGVSDFYKAELKGSQ